MPIDPNNPYPQPDMPQYMADQNNLLANQQLQFQNQTIYAAQSRMQDNLQATLQGTMAAAQAASQGFYSIARPFHEKIYNDLYFGNGQYALERSMTRDVLFGTGIAQSGFGRALQIGGRKPEFMDKSLFYHEMQRSVDLRKEELGDSLISGGAAGAGAALGLSMGFLPGMLVGAAFDFGAEAINQRRQYSRDIREFSAITDMNKGVGNRRISANVASQIASEFIGHDLNIGQALPLIGDRFKPDTSYSETFKKMGQLGLLRGTNTNDAKEIAELVKATAKQVEEFAGLAKITKDEALKLKATFNEMGISGTKTNAAMNLTLKASYSTGLDVNTVAGLFGAAEQSGLRYGYSAGAGSALEFTNLKQVSALREAGIIDRRYDAAALSMERTQNQQAFGKSMTGLLTAFGGVGGGRRYLAGLGGGDIQMGLMAFQDTMLNAGPDATKLLYDSADALYKNFGGGKKGMVAAMRIIESTPGVSQQIIDQVREHLTGLDKLGDKLGDQSVFAKRASELGISSDVFRMQDLFNIDNNGNLIAKDLNKYSDLIVTDTNKRAKLAGLALANEDVSSYSKYGTITGFSKGVSAADKLTHNENIHYNSYIKNDFVKDQLKKYKEALFNGDNKSASEYRAALIKVGDGYGDGKGREYFATLLDEDSRSTGNTIGDLFQRQKLISGDFFKDYDPSKADDDLINKLKSKGISEKDAIQLIQNAADTSNPDNAKSTIDKLNKILGNENSTVSIENGKIILKTRNTTSGGMAEAKAGASYTNTDLTQSLLKLGLGNNFLDKKTKIALSNFSNKLFDDKKIDEKVESRNQFENETAVAAQNFYKLGLHANNLTKEEKETFTSAGKFLFGDTFGNKLKDIAGTAFANPIQNFLKENGGELFSGNEDEKTALMDDLDKSSSDASEQQALTSLTAACTAIANKLSPGWDKDIKKDAPVPKEKPGN